MPPTVQRGHLVAEFLGQEVEQWSGDCLSVAPEGPDAWLVTWDEWDEILNEMMHPADAAAVQQDILSTAPGADRSISRLLEPDLLDEFKMTRNAPAWVREWNGPFEIDLTVRGTLTSDVVTGVDLKTVFPVEDRARVLERHADTVIEAILRTPDPADADIADAVRLVALVTDRVLPLLADHADPRIRAAATARIVHAATA